MAPFRRGRSIRPASPCDPETRAERWPKYQVIARLPSVKSDTSSVNVRWHDGYLETFEDVTEARFGSDLLWLRLATGQNRHIPLRSVRWFSLGKESHEVTG